ncbi:right-handed parallel beta-helix repeat-containing protein [Streptosporangium saharense]|uniref:Parallel beta-helix repeat protein n=1 Tax=Streptosporangium saharense TaxID=1706840 RepID=A0A7W7QKV4_9ACTN|nr:right-handed parallel beta-helix repeat-containing protein [Streptosporangium saharense]MBB4915363.1 parallel beta-helix repeat protein [Streptosporangium saharense]
MKHGKEPGKQRLAKTAAAFALSLAAALAIPLPASATDDEVGCGAVLTSNVTLTQDLSCAGDGLTIGADNVTVDLAGHTVSGDGTGRGVAVGDRKGVAVRDGVISGFGLGAETVGGGVTFSRVRFVGNALSADHAASLTLVGPRSACLAEGIDVTGSSVLTIDRCTVHGRLYGSGGHGWTVRGSVLSNGHLELAESGSNVFGGNLFDGFPVNLTEGSNDNLYTDNVFTNAQVGFRAEHSTGAPNRVEGNVFKDNRYGMTFWVSFSNVSVKGNRFEGNRIAGILIDPIRFTGVTPYPVSGNTFVHNGLAAGGAVDRDGDLIRDGVHVSGTERAPVELARNGGTGNGGFVIWGPAGQVIDGGGNHGPCGPVANPGLNCS